VPRIRNILLENKAWVAEKTEINPEYFSELSKDQAPLYLWIGCSDSRVNPNEITGTALGEMFVHRNIANLVHEDDLNLMSVIAYGVNYLSIKHIIVCGHYGCGGIKSALTDQSFGIIDGWLVKIKKLIKSRKQDLDGISDETEKVNRLVDLNVIEQVRTLSEIDFLSNAVAERGITIHGWVYQMGSGKLKELVRIDGQSTSKI
jgi:carbonic anhydrase